MIFLFFGFLYTWAKTSKNYSTQTLYCRDCSITFCVLANFSSIVFLTYCCKINVSTGDDTLSLGGTDLCVEKREMIHHTVFFFVALSYFIFYYDPKAINDVGSSFFFFHVCDRSRFSLRRFLYHASKITYVTLRFMGSHQSIYTANNTHPLVGPRG